MNRLIEVTDPTGGKTRLTYDRSGRRTSLVFGNGIVGTYGYDAAGRLTSIVYVSPRGELIEAFLYLLDRAGNRLTKQFADGRRETYGYDAANRLTEAVYRDGKRQLYSLDRVGNRGALDEYDGQGKRLKYESYTHNAFNQILTRRISTYGAGATTTNEVYGWDLQGAMTSVAGTTYSYNSNERLTRIAFPASRALPDSVFAYDADGLRVRKEEGGETTQQLLDGPHIRAEYDATGAMKAYYVQNPQRIDEILVAHVRDAAIPGPLQAVYPLTDALGSIYAETDQAGSRSRCTPARPSPRCRSSASLPRRGPWPWGRQRRLRSTWFGSSRPQAIGIIWRPFCRSWPKRSTAGGSPRSLNSSDCRIRSASGTSFTSLARERSPSHLLPG